jgi:hypothetical protein
MRWVTYLASTGTPRVGLVDGDCIRALPDVRSLRELLGDDGERLTCAATVAMANPQEVIALDARPLLAPTPHPPSVRDFMAFEEHVINTRRPGQTVEPLWYEQPVLLHQSGRDPRTPRSDPGRARLGAL